MADMVLGAAQGAVGLLLGRLTSALAEEAQLLGSVRRDMQFIKDEMESMNGFLLHAAEAAAARHGDEDQRARAWMKQVADVAYASRTASTSTSGASPRPPGRRPRSKRAFSATSARWRGWFGHCRLGTASRCRSGS
jgi:hypothetical protein